MSGRRRQELDLHDPLPVRDVELGEHGAGGALTKGLFETLTPVRAAWLVLPD